MPDTTTKPLEFVGFTPSIAVLMYLRQFSMQFGVSPEEYVKQAVLTALKLDGAFKRKY